MHLSVTAWNAVSVDIEPRASAGAKVSKRMNAWPHRQDILYMNSRTRYAGVLPVMCLENWVTHALRASGISALWPR